MAPATADLATRAIYFVQRPNGIDTMAHAWGKR
jgi:hypothetical protein